MINAKEDVCIYFLLRMYHSSVSKNLSHTIRTELEQIKKSTLAFVDTYIMTRWIYGKNN
jgi:hypothetical protein